MEIKKKNEKEKLSLMGLNGYGKWSCTFKLKIAYNFTYNFVFFFFIFILYDIVIAII